MRTAVVAPVVIAALAVGLLVGGLVGRSTAVPVPAVQVGAAEIDPEARARTWDPTERSGEQAGSLSRKGVDGEIDARRERRTRDVRERESARDDPRSSAEPVEATDGGSDSEIEALTRELAALRREHAELRDEHTELVGEPLPQPSDVEPRFSGPSLTASVGQAIGQAGVEGKVEHVDCSEYPCITFGRLAGDEEEMEEIERAAALSPYDADVLTLLFWAASADSSQAPGAKETGLFALAFYTQDDRATEGAALDRRIRARTVEYWNTDKPDRPAAAAVD